MNLVFSSLIVNPSVAVSRHCYWSIGRGVSSALVTRNTVSIITWNASRPMTLDIALLVVHFFGSFCEISAHTVPTAKTVQLYILIFTLCLSRKRWCSSKGVNGWTRKIQHGGGWKK